MRFAHLYFLALSCGDHDHQKHEHAEEEAHGHGEEAEDPRPTVVVTLYQGALELFMEHPALVVGQESPLIAHFTDTRDAAGFVWVTEGQVVATLKFADGQEERFVADKLLRNGIFKPVVKPSRAGRARFTLELKGHPAAGVVDVGEVEVWPTVEAAVAAAPPEEEGEATLPYLKESQWQTRYATSAARDGEARQGVPATAELRAPAGAEAELSAPVGGRLQLRRALHVGMQVRQGEVLADVLPVVDADRAGVEAGAIAASAELEVAEAALQRAKSLHPAVVSDRELGMAEAQAAAARARAEAAGLRLKSLRGLQAGSAGGNGSFALRAPFDGVVTRAVGVTGQSVAAGQAVVHLVDPRKVWLVAQVPESEAARAAQPAGAAFTLSGSVEPIDVAARGGRLVSVGAALDPVSRTLPVIYELDNQDGSLKPGMFARAWIYTAEAKEAVLIPAAAVVDDGGRPTVFVMEGGEGFFRRRVKLGTRDGEEVQVISGVKGGERVVSVGAYELYLSSISGEIPEHGHGH